MSCFNPISALLGEEKPNGKRTVTFLGAKDRRMEGYTLLPCGKCIGCLRNRAREWTIRLVHESKICKYSCFITLTYRNKDLPKDGSINIKEFQDFMKRLRKHIWKTEKTKVRFFHCGEYGSKLQRPHYHCLLFGYNFPDKRLHSTNGLGQAIYRSQILEQLWPKGFSTIGDVTPMSAGYVAKYTFKKRYGNATTIQNHYGKLKHEYVTMSRKPGIGRKWYEKYKTDIYPSGVLVFNGYKQMPPRYYDSLYEKENPDGLQAIKEDRKARASRIHVTDTINGRLKMVDNNDSFRLPVREKIVLQRMKNLKRFYEDK